MKHLSIDIETYSDVDIGKSGMYRYADSDTFEIMLFAYSADGGAVEVIDIMNGGMIPQHIIQALFDSSVIKHAFNAAFEWYCLSKYFSVSNPLEWLKQWRCTMVHGLYCSFPASLGAVGEALGLPEDKQKNTIGKSLIRLFCTPQTPTKTNGNRTRTLPKHEPEKWGLFIEYNRQDVVTETEVERRLSGFPVPDEVWQQWFTDMRINLNGVKIDAEMVHGAVEMANTEKAELTVKAAELSGLGNPSSNTQFAKYLKDNNIDVPDTRKETLEELAKTELPPEVSEMLRLKGEISKTSNKKYEAMINTACSDSRIRGTLQFYGASRTGRWGGRFVQPQNLPRTYIHGDMLPYARELVRQRNANAIKLIFGSISDTLSQLIRTAIVADEGYTFIDADFSAIEARVVAWLAGEQWVIDVFNTHGKIYEATASQMFGVPIDKIKKGNPEYSLRQKGKVATLALGYGGTTNALINMGALRMGLSEDELPEIVSRWRAANRRICDLWYKIENAVLQTFKTGVPTAVNGLIMARECDSLNGLDFITVTLPSKRKMFYALPHLGKNRWGNDSLHYFGVNNAKKWGSLETYGGKLTENIVQAIARDCLALKIEQLTATGYKIVFHVHDEVVIEAPEECADLEAVCRIMSEPIPWAPGLPLNADGYVSKFFKKD
ncbi:MAG: DNA polymerase [bacterium]|nr:DNA polymerase [bacterium]